MGFGQKTNYKTSKTFNLDKTYKNVIKPVFEDLGFICYRADDLPPSGLIDVAMYDNILKADFVIADLSTLNPNAFYELGIRHALKKNTTILIAENGTDFPFDLNHNYIHSYEHLGKDIGVDEANRFKTFLSKTVKELLKEPGVDSPVYTYLPGLNTPSFTDQEIKDIKEEIEEEETSVADFLEIAETALENQNHQVALRYLEKAAEIYPNNDFINQQRVVNTYKSKLPDQETALKNALDILKKELNLKTTTDPESLGLAGAIYKRLYSLTQDTIHFEQALWNYGRGFYIKQDYYNGINLAFLFMMKASQTDDQFAAFASYGQAQEVYKKVGQWCHEIIASENFENRTDKVWIYQTLSEVAFANGNLTDESNYLDMAKETSNGSFALSSYQEQRMKLEKAIKTFTTKFNI